MQCKHKHTTIGQVIHPEQRDGCIIMQFDNKISNDNMRVIYCEKCSDCGHSEYLDDSDQFTGRGIKVPIDKLP